ncbi:2_t:CDS:2 [Funneliformis geosporum]|uniref:5623_t:CDS:1 n=1 Tax=Funneliformis geosporum TaxID=1117311 RepID=A0A9W4SV45_9GLOM|nr:5623_t:CDS:2 [Funneliformis geosporum]CAI2193047.1 2_t:CDS:2 [Funneliformis geosporum]
MPSTPIINDDDETPSDIIIKNELVKDIDNEIDFKQSFKQDEFFSFFNLNDNIEHIYIKTEDSDDENNITEIIIEEIDKVFHSTCTIMTMDLKAENITKCQNSSIRKLWQLVGIWEVNSESVKEVKAEPSKLSVCKTHFNLDQTFHKTGLKAKISKE